MSGIFLAAAPHRPENSASKKVPDTFSTRAASVGSNGNGNGAASRVASAPAVAGPAPRPGPAAIADVEAALGALSEQFAAFQADAPICENCGSITVRNGNCYLCHVCGSSLGCS